jgi:hypothetical protein
MVQPTGNRLAIRTSTHAARTEYFFPFMAFPQAKKICPPKSTGRHPFPTNESVQLVSWLQY